MAEIKSDLRKKPLELGYDKNLWDGKILSHHMSEYGGWNKLEQGKPVVPYCAGKTCNASRRAGEILESHGMKVYVYEGGISEWRDSGYPMEGEKYTEK